jgi:hypothetical protein
MRALGCGGCKRALMVRRSARAVSKEEGFEDHEAQQALADAASIYAHCRSKRALTSPIIASPICVFG